MKKLREEGTKQAWHDFLITCLVASLIVIIALIGLWEGTKWLINSTVSTIFFLNISYCTIN